MAQSKRLEDLSQATNGTKSKSASGKYGHWLRVIVMICSGGFIFPHAMTEGMDEEGHDAKKDTESKKQ
jgi:hypothetical protein